MVFRIAALIAVPVLATWGAHLVRDALDLQLRPDDEQRVHRAIMLGAAAYVGRLALPFVPGAEIGLEMLAAFGPAIAPLVYVCTVASMMLAFAVGRFLPPIFLDRLLSVLRLLLAAALVVRAAPLGPEDRLAMLLDTHARRAAGVGLRYRDVALALAVNTSDNSVIGVGGGTMIMAGLSGNVSPLRILLTVALAVSPVPLAVIVFGLRF